MSAKLWGFIAVALGALVLISNTFFIVPETQQVLVLQFGDAKRTINASSAPESQAGLYAKIPFIQDVVRYDRRNLGLDLDDQPILAGDQERLEIDAFARWRVTDPLRFRTSLQNEDQARDTMRSVMTSALRGVLGQVPANDIISGRRGELMVQIAKDFDRQVKDYGVAILDVKIVRAEFPTATRDRVFEQMKTDRQQVAAKLRAEGKEKALKIRAEAARQVLVTKAEAREKAEQIRGEGDAKRAEIFANSFGRDPEFAAFYRSMQAYEKAIPKGTQMVMPPDGEFFRYMRDKEGGR